MGRDPSTNESERKYPEFIGEGWAISLTYNSQFSSNHHLGMALKPIADSAFTCTQELLDQDSAQQPPSIHSHTFDCQALKPQISLSLNASIR